MKTFLAMFALSVMCLHAADTVGPKAFQAQLIEIARETQQLRAELGERTEGKLGGIIERCEKITPGPEATDEERLMRLGILAELLSLNGQYDLSNKSYEKAFEINPNFGFYRKMVVNLRLKGDPAAAKALVENYRKILIEQYPGDDHEMRRQDMLQFVESELTSELPKR